MGGRFLPLCFMALHMVCLQKDQSVCCDCCMKYVLILQNNKIQTWGSYPASFLLLFKAEFHFDSSLTASSIISSIVIHSSYWFPRKEVWATFPRQNEAMNFAKEHGNMRVFSYQDHYKGQRRFLVSTYQEFWRRFSCLTFIAWLPNHSYPSLFEGFSHADFLNYRYKSMDSKFRHHYEVIQEVITSLFPFYKSKHSRTPHNCKPWLY